MHNAALTRFYAFLSFFTFYSFFEFLDKFPTRFTAFFFWLSVSNTLVSVFSFCFQCPFVVSHFRFFFTPVSRAFFNRRLSRPPSYFTCHPWVSFFSQKSDFFSSSASQIPHTVVHIFFADLKMIFLPSEFQNLKCQCKRIPLFFRRNQNIFKKQHSRTHRFTG